MSTHQTVDLPKGFIVQAPPGKQFHDGEPVMVFRAQDALSARIIRFYWDLLREEEADPSQIDAVEGKYEQFCNWQLDNSDIVKMPDYKRP